MTKTQVAEPAEHGVSYELGFLSPDPPSRSFANPYFHPWDEINSKLASLLESGMIKKEIERLPLLSAQKLSSELDYQRAYVVLGFLTHAFVWSDNPPNATIPCQVAEPFLDVCEHLGLEPVLSYAGLVLWNWQLNDPNNKAIELENLVCIASFTGTRAEDVFNLVPVLTEAEGGKLVGLTTAALDAAEKGNAQAVIASLDCCAETLIAMASILPQLYSHLDAHMFYHTLRPYLSGSKGMEEKGLPQGMVFKRSDGSEKQAKRVGGSAVQSSLFPFIDYALGVVHRPLEGGPKESIFQEMRAYMPGRHRHLLDHMSKITPIRSFVEKNPADAELTRAYNNCLQQLRSWRSKHIAVVSKYIVQPARAAAKLQEQAAHLASNGANGHANPGSNSNADEEFEVKGTGGSSLIPFLRQARDETKGVD